MNENTEFGLLLTFGLFGTVFALLSIIHNLILKAKHQDLSTQHQNLSIDFLKLRNNVDKISTTHTTEGGGFSLNKRSGIKNLFLLFGILLLGVLNITKIFKNFFV